MKKTLSNKRCEMFTTDDIAETVKEVVVDHLMILIDDYDEKALLFEDLGADELDLLEIGLDLERIFEVDLPSEEPYTDYAEMKCSADYIRFFESKIKTKNVEG